MNLDALAKIVSRWAASTPNVKAAHLFGSRAKGTSHAGSDLDVAIELDGDDDGFANWICDAGDMRDSLSILLPVPLDLQMMHSQDDIVMPAVRDHGFEVFRKANS